MKCYNITLLIFITMIGRIMLHKKTLLFAALSAALWGGATQAADAAVVASLKPVGFIASAIADGVTETEVLLPDGASEHDYSLRPSDVKRLQNADLVVWVGPEMEAFMQKPVSKLPEAKQVTIAQLEDVKPLLMKSIHGDDDDHDHAIMVMAMVRHGMQTGQTEHSISTITVTETPVEQSCSVEQRL